MCLEILDNFKIKRYVGYKVFYVSSSGKLYGELKARKKLRKPNTWLNSYSFSKIPSVVLLFPDSDTNGRYTNGWHIYLRRKDAVVIQLEYYTVKRVRFRKVVAKGREVGCKVVVSKEIFIEE